MEIWSMDSINLLMVKLDLVRRESTSLLLLDNPGSVDEGVAGIRGPDAT